MLENTPRVGDLIFHNSQRELRSVYPEDVVYFGRTPECILPVGETGYLITFQIMSDLGKKVYMGVGLVGEWMGTGYHYQEQSHAKCCNTHKEKKLPKVPRL